MTYLKQCKVCKTKTEHLIRRVNVLRGVKLMCCSCGSESNRYYNLNKLKPIQKEFHNET
jgi:hypothetical protein